MVIQQMIFGVDIPPLIITSALFATMVIHAAIRRKWDFAVAWLALMATSLLHHSSDHGQYAVIDKVMVYIVVFMGFVLLLAAKSWKAWIIPVITFSCVVVLYFGGIGHHAMVHFASLVGHHSILLYTV